MSFFQSSTELFETADKKTLIDLKARPELGF